MREIDNYIDSLYKNIDGISKENKEIKGNYEDSFNRICRRIKIRRI
ncbi:hypothetical protein ACSXCI_11760 [Clostridium perfringens]